MAGQWRKIIALELHTWRTDISLRSLQKEVVIENEKNGHSFAKNVIPGAEELRIPDDIGGHLICHPCNGT